MLTIDEVLARALGPPSPNKERVRALVEMVGVARVARTVGVSESAVRKWRDGHSEPTGNHAQIVDDLRETALVLVEAGLTVEEAGRWFTSRCAELGLQRPLEVIGEAPIEVISAAQEPWLQAREAVNG